MKKKKKERKAVYAIGPWPVRNWAAQQGVGGMGVSEALSVFTALPIACITT